MRVAVACTGRQRATQPVRGSEMRPRCDLQAVLSADEAYYQAHVEQIRVQHFDAVVSCIFIAHLSHIALSFLSMLSEPRQLCSLSAQIVYDM